MITITELVCTSRPFLKEEELIAFIYVDSVMANNVVLEDLNCSDIFQCCIYKNPFLYIYKNIEAEINQNFKNVLRTFLRLSRLRKYLTACFVLTMVFLLHDTHLGL